MNHRVRNMLGLNERRPKQAAVFGSGPAGLFAVHGLVENGWQVKIFSAGKKSTMYGAQYLHAPIDGLSRIDEEAEKITYRLNGTVDGYRDKVYGSTPVKVSPQMLETEHLSWDIREAYDYAWSLYSGRIEWLKLSPRAMGIFQPEEGEPAPDDVKQYWGAFDLIINTVPMPELCYRRDEHLFHSTQVWAIGDARDRGQLAPYRPDLNVVECNGTTDVGWYRAANIRGHVTVEWPGKSRPPLPQAVPVNKPLYTDCTCYRDGSFPIKFIPMGRYGAWSKGVLSHHSYTQAANL